MDPNIVGGPAFRELWRFQSPYNSEKHLAKPLVFTTPGGTEVVITASEMNIVRVIDAKTGELLNQRTLNPPFLTSDIGCPDIPDFIGITGTPIIDPDTAIM